MEIFLKKMGRPEILRWPLGRSFKKPIFYPQNTSFKKAGLFPLLVRGKSPLFKSAAFLQKDPPVLKKKAPLKSQKRPFLGNIPFKNGWV